MARKVDGSVKNNGSIDKGDNDREDNHYDDPITELTAAKLIDKTSDNLALAEARTDEHPLWTPKTAELEQRENEDNNKNRE
jgi:hypothetical protein